MTERDDRGRRPTIRDVAAKAGVSKSLVSLVMRGEPMVREDKRQRVQEAAEELGYRMNTAARSLSKVRSHTVGVLVADLRNPSLIDVVEAAREVLEEAGLSTLLMSAVAPSRPTGGPRMDVRAVGALKDLRVEAVLVVGSVPDRPTLTSILGDVPMVVAAAAAEGLHADVVRNDDRLGMRLIVDYLVTVPDDLALTGYDDTFVAAIRPLSLTSVNPDSSAIGSLAARCLLRRIESPEAARQEHLLAPRLTARYSSGLRAVPRAGSSPVGALVSTSSVRQRHIR